MTWLHSIVLGVVQGITEILPISSDGHLTVLQHILKVPNEVRLTLTATLHLGTALAILLFFRSRVKELVIGVFASDYELQRRSRFLILLLIIATIPGVLAGIFLEKWVEKFFASDSLITVGIFFLINGLLLFSTYLFKRRKGSREIGWQDALLIGVAQILAILPAISRSGVTISAGLLLGLDRKDAFDFSFLLAIPITLGAAIFEMSKIDFSVLPVLPVLLGVALAGGFGFMMLSLLRGLVLRQCFYIFSLYCWAIGILVLLFSS